MNNQDQDKDQKTENPRNPISEMQVSAIKSTYNPAKTNWKFIMIVAVLGLFVGGVMLIFQNSLYQPQSIQVSQPQIQKPAPKEPQPQEKVQTEVDISTWQTYRNDEFGFEVRYPSILQRVDTDRRYSNFAEGNVFYADGKGGV